MRRIAYIYHLPAISRRKKKNHPKDSNNAKVNHPSERYEIFLRKHSLVQYISKNTSHRQLSRAPENGITYLLIPKKALHTVKHLC
jgi:hypothetical protein